MSLFNSLKVSEILNQYISNGKCIKFWWQFNAVLDVLCLLYNLLILPSCYVMVLLFSICSGIWKFELFFFNVIVLHLFWQNAHLNEICICQYRKELFFLEMDLKKKSQNCGISHIWKVYSVFSSFFYAFELLMTRASGSIPMNFLFQVKFDCSKTCAGGSPCHLAVILSCCVSHSHLWPFFWYSVNDFVFLFI
jgi:hypothetical protein